MRPHVHLKQTMLARYLGYLLMEFDQTFTTTDFGARMKTLNFLGQKFKGQGHGGVKYATKCTF